MKIQKITSINYSNHCHTRNTTNTNSVTINNINNSKNINFGGWFWFKKGVKPVIDTNCKGLKLIENRRNLTPHILCGGLGNMISTFRCSDKKVFAQLKKSAKIDTVIYFGENATITDKMQNTMKQAGIKYFNFDIWGIEQNWFKKESGDKVSIIPKYYENLKEFLNTLNSGDNVLMGCDQGKYRTSQALFLNHFLNKNRPSGEHTLNCCLNIGDFIILENYRNTEKIFETLTPQQKAELGIADRKLPKIDMTDFVKAIKKVKETFLAD